MQIREMTTSQQNTFKWVIAIILLFFVATLLGGCQSTLPKRVEVRPDGTTITTVDTDATAALATVANGVAQSAIKAARELAEIRTALATKPMSTEERLAAEQNAAIKQKLLDALIAKLNATTTTTSK